MRVQQLGWLVLRVQTNHEQKVKRFLHDTNIQCFLPTISQVRQWSDRRRTIFKPIFPSYIFVNISNSKEFYKALQARSVYHYLKCGDQYSKVKDEEIDRIKFLVGDKTITNLDVLERPLKEGDKAILNTGMLSGIECTVIKVRNKRKICVSINSINKFITAEVPVSYLTFI